MTIYTIGHSNRSLAAFLELLKDHGIEQLFDLRRFPVSSKFPHFNREYLEAELNRHGIAYMYFGETLGGYRTGGYEMYMSTSAFQEGLRDLQQKARDKRSCLMCAEMLYFRCHRRFVSDALVRNGWEVIHIIDERRTARHKLRDLFQQK